MYIGQQVGYRFKELADAFAVAHVGTISHALTHGAATARSISEAGEAARAGAAWRMVVIQ